MAAKRTLSESGEWRDGAAVPKLLPENLRKLPGELVGSDVDDPSKAHELDAPHVVAGVIREFDAKIKAEEAPEQKPKTPRQASKKLRAPGPGEYGPVVQSYVDVARMRVLQTLVNEACARFEAGLPTDLGVKHLWFPNPRNVNEYELRQGPAPIKRERPKHMRELDLEVDVVEPPRMILRMLRDMGVEYDPTKLFEESQEKQRLEARERERRLVIEI